MGGDVQRTAPFRRRKARRRDVLFVSGPGDDALRYRCAHQAEQLRLLGLTADVGHQQKLDLEQLASRYATIVLYRVPWSDRVARLLEIAAEAQTCVLADVDDLVFDPAKADLLRWVDDLESMRESMSRLRRTLAAVDGVLVSTDPLVGAARSVNDRTAVAYNAVSAAMVSSRRSRAKRGSGIVLAYLSGTRTHDRDFLEAESAVVWALESFVQVKFWAAGFLELGNRLDRFGDRVVRLPYRPWKRLPALYAQIDINLAPLEAENEFTDAKSCIKYLEAAVHAVPTVASATSDFRRAIEQGATGFVVASDDDWRGALEELISSGERRHMVGVAAREDVLAQHTTAARAPELLVAVESLSRPLESGGV